MATHNTFVHFPVVQYDGTNHEQFLKAMKIEVGDAIVSTSDGGVVLLKATEMEKLLAAPSVHWLESD